MYCRKEEASSSNANSNDVNANSNQPTSNEAGSFKQRVEDYCELAALKPTFTQFCQPDALLDSTPIAAILLQVRCSSNAPW